MEKAYFGAGCFWGVEANFKEIQGVEDTTVGYGGGDVQNPTYHQVCDGETGHAELVEVVFNPSELSYEKLVKTFFGMHNPTTLNRQGVDVGSQYRSVIYTISDQQASVAEQVKQDLTTQGVYDKPIVTLIEPFKNFYEAEEYHQDYLDKNPGICHI